LIFCGKHLSEGSQATLHYHQPLQPCNVVILWIAEIHTDSLLHPHIERFPADKILSQFKGVDACLTCVLHMQQRTPYFTITKNL